MDMLTNFFRLIFCLINNNISTGKFTIRYVCMILKFLLISLGSELSQVFEKRPVMFTAFIYLVIFPLLVYISFAFDDLFKSVYRKIKLFFKNCYRKYMKEEANSVYWIPIDGENVVINGFENPAFQLYNDEDISFVTQFENN